jgi:hypothetical protein
MQDNYRDQAASSFSADQKVDDVIDSEDDNTDRACSLDETNFRELMTQREMEILTTLFPKTARALASVLSNRPQ